MIHKSVFISYNRSDKLFARKIANDLRIRGALVWIDEGEIKIGDSLIEKIREGIDQVEFLAVVLSPDSVESEWVKREVDIAMNQEIEGRRVKVLPLLYRQCDLPGFLKGKLYADFTSEENYQTALGLLLQRLEIKPMGGDLFMFRKDINGKFRYANTALIKAFAIDAKDLIGKTDNALYNHDMAKNYITTDLEVIRQGEAMAYYEVQKAPGGDELLVQVIKHPTFDEHGNIDGVEGIYWIPLADE